MRTGRYAHLPPFEDALLVPTEGQKSALVTLAQCGGDQDAVRLVEYQIRAWDKALGRGDTLQLSTRITRAREVWDGYIYENGGGI